MGHVNSAHIESVAALGDRGFVAAPPLEGEQSNVRVIRIARGQALPPHRHGQSDLMLSSQAQVNLRRRQVRRHFPPAHWRVSEVTKNCRSATWTSRR
jgi:hypothetical protein